MSPARQIRFQDCADQEKKPKNLTLVNIIWFISCRVYIRCREFRLMSHHLNQQPENRLWYYIINADGKKSDWRRGSAGN